MQSASPPVDAGASAVFDAGGGDAAAAAAAGDAASFDIGAAAGGQTRCLGNAAVWAYACSCPSHSWPSASLNLNLNRPGDALEARRPW